MAWYIRQDCHRLRFVTIISPRWLNEWLKLNVHWIIAMKMNITIVSKSSSTKWSVFLITIDIDFERHFKIIDLQIFVYLQPLDHENVNDVHAMLINRTSAQPIRPKHRSAPDEFHDTDIDRPIHQYSTRCQNSLQICTKDNSKSIVPSCKCILTVYSLPMPSK